MPRFVSAPRRQAAAIAAAASPLQAEWSTFVQRVSAMGRRDGTTAVVMTKGVSMERLCALVPRPRRHLVTYHGVLAPAAGLRPQVVPAMAAGPGRRAVRTACAPEDASRSMAMLCGGVPPAPREAAGALENLAA